MLKLNEVSKSTYLHLSWNSLHLRIFTRWLQVLFSTSDSFWDTSIFMKNPIKLIVFCISLSPRFFTPLNWNTPQWKKAPLLPLPPPFLRSLNWNTPKLKKATPPPLPKPPFLLFHNWNTPQWKKTPHPSLPNPPFFTSSKLEHIPMKEGTLPPLP